MRQLVKFCDQHYGAKNPVFKYCLTSRLISHEQCDLYANVLSKNPRKNNRVQNLPQNQEKMEGLLNLSRYSERSNLKKDANF